MTFWQTVGLYALAYIAISVGLVALIARGGRREKWRTRWNREGGE